MQLYYFCVFYPPRICNHTQVTTCPYYFYCLLEKNSKKSFCFSLMNRTRKSGPEDECKKIEPGNFNKGIQTIEQNAFELDQNNGACVEESQQNNRRPRFSIKHSLLKKE